MTDVDCVVRVPLVDPSRAVLGPLCAIEWRNAAMPHEDIPGRVRAGSAVRRWRDHLCIVQDDVRALALVDSRTALALQAALARTTALDPRSAWSTDAGRIAVDAAPLLLPADDRGARTFDDTRGNKAGKLDLEAAVVLPDGRLLVFGSGATRVRERIVVVAGEPARARVVDAHALYARIHEGMAAAGAALASTDSSPATHSASPAVVPNVEGAVATARALTLFHRAVGMAHAGAARYALNLTFDFDLDGFLAWLDHAAAAPHIERIVAFDLGLADGAVVGFTDAALQPDGTIAFLACAELTGDPVVDGRVVTTRVGVLDGVAGWQSEILDVGGVRVSDKLEGLEPAGVPGAFVVVSDADDPALPARIAGLRLLTGPVDGAAPAARNGSNDDR